MSRDEALLPKWAEQMLQALPVPERDWEAQLGTVQARLAEVAIGSTDARLLEAPLPMERPPVATPTPPAAGSLADLARQVAQRTARKESTLVRDSLQVAASQRARTAPPGAVERAERASGATTTAAAIASMPAVARTGAAVPRTTAAPAPAVPPAPAVAPAPAAPPATAVTHQRSRAVMPFLVGAGVALAAAASWVAITRPEPEPAAVASVADRAPPVAAAPAPTAPGMAPAPAAEDATAAGRAAPPGAPDTAPAAPPAAQETATRAPVARAESPASSAVAAKPATSPRGAARKGSSAEPQERVVLEETPPQQASSARSPLLRPAAGLPGELPERPSSGAIQAALGSVMGSARACLAGATTPAIATVVFGSDGRVVSARVSAPLAGTPAGSCVETALARARVQPFLQATTSVGGIAVRP